MNRIARWSRYCLAPGLPGLLLAAGLFATGQEAKKAAAPELDADHAAKMARGLDLFKKYVRPILEQNCLRCHGGKRVESELDLSDRDSLVKGGQHGPVIVPGKSKDSLLLKLVRHQQKPHMPHEGDKLP